LFEDGTHCENFREVIHMAIISREEPKFPTEDDIERRAYEIYLEEGREDGHAEEHWLRAESELAERPRAASGKGKSAAASLAGTPNTQGSGK
jgi:hypothetical protein